jgi:HEAT repeat protein
MTRSASLWCLWILGCVGCSTTGSGVSDPSIEEQFAAREQQAEEDAARRSAPERVLLDLDMSLDKFAEFVHSSGSMRMDANIEKLDAYLRQQAKTHFEILLHEAENAAIPRNRAIAVAALGFSGEPEALDPLLNALTADDAEVVTNAVFGLAILRDARTPPSSLAAIIEDETRTPELRASAAWSLHELQQAVVDADPIVAVWRRILSGEIDAQPSGVNVQALRGLGEAMRDAGKAAEPSEEVQATVRNVERYASHPTPMVRWAAAIALGRMGDEDCVPVLLTLIGPGESNQNVRLGARKALQALAGGTDLGYDVREWSKLFERGP